MISARCYRGWLAGFSLVLAAFSAQAHSPQATLTVAAVGDVLLHAPLQQQAARSPDGFKSLWDPLVPRLEAADMAYANLEGPVAAGLTRSGVERPIPVGFDNQVYTSYPQFNYPDRLLSDLKESGIDVVSTANNHALDRGSRGVTRTIEALTRTGLPFFGTREVPESSAAPRPWSVRVSRRGATVAWIACSYGTNGIADGKHQVLNCDSDRDALLEEVRRQALDPQVAAVIVTPHWGVEYTNQPREQEKKLAHALVEAGAAVVLGSHPHVTQPWERYVARDGRPALIVYSMGNFVSGQFQRVETRSGVLIELVFQGVPGHRYRWVSAHASPLEMVRVATGLQVQPMGLMPFSAPMLARFFNQFGAPATLLAAPPEEGSHPRP